MALDPGFGQLTWDGESGPFDIVTAAWHPIDNGLTQLLFPNDIEVERRKVGPGDYIEGPQHWSPTVVQIPMYLFGDRDPDGDPFADPHEGLESNLNRWVTELCVPGTTGRDGVFTTPSGEEREGRGTAFRVTGPGRRKPSGWPIMFEFTLLVPFTVAP